MARSRSADSGPLQSFGVPTAIACLPLSDDGPALLCIHCRTAGLHKWGHSPSASQWLRRANHATNYRFM